MHGNEAKGSYQSCKNKDGEVSIDLTGKKVRGRGASHICKDEDCLQNPLKLKKVRKKPRSYYK